MTFFLPPETCTGPDEAPGLRKCGKPSVGESCLPEQGGLSHPSARPACWEQGGDRQALARVCGDLTILLLHDRVLQCWEEVRPCSREL